MDKLVDDTLVGLRRLAAGAVAGLFHGEQGGFACLMGGLPLLVHPQRMRHRQLYLYLGYGRRKPGV